MKRRLYILIILLLKISMAGCDRTDKTDIKAVPEKSFKNSIGMEMICLSSGYWVAKYEATQQQYEEIMGNNPTYHEYVGNDKPVSNVKGFEAEDFCSRLTEKEKQNGSLQEGYVYALPSFKEWLEYVADASLEGSVTPGNYNYPRNSASPQPVGSGEKNRLGIYDLRGNVCEYSRDKDGKSSYFFGASWYEHRKDFLRVKNKATFGAANAASSDVGFRYVLIKKSKL